jgi:uncharacterized membrane protein YphA (DoxX/SURF4 family)
VEERPLFKVIRVAIRLVLGAVFLAAGVSKAWEPMGFVQAIEGYRMLPGWLALPVAFYLPFLEIVCGILLVAGKFVRESAAILAVLLVVFMGAIVQAWIRGLSIDCGCFGGGVPGRNYLLLLVRDAALVAMAGWLVGGGRSRRADRV